jgi:hypothetical protein
MRANSVSSKEVAVVMAVILLNAVVLSQLVGGAAADRPPTAFAQPYDNGFPCLDPSECASGFCEQGVCCNQECNGTSRTCNQPTSLGECTSVLPAPTLSWPGQLIAASLLTLLGWFGLRRLRRTS